MNHLPRSRLAVLAFAAVLAASSVLPAAAQEGSSGGESSDVVPRLVWMVLGVACFALVMAALYLFKRAMGGFPRNPSWIPPISIRPSSEFPGDSDPHEATSPTDDHRPGVQAHPAGHH